MKNILITAILCLSIAGFSQEKSSPTPAAPKQDFAPTEIQRLKLENLQLKAKLAQAEQAKAQANFQGSLNELFTYSNTVRTENKWGEDVSFDVDSLKFTGTAPKKDVKK
jgi:hypothetical protein